MGVGDASCILCGTSIDHEEKLPQWMGRFRVLYAVGAAWNDARLSGVGLRRQSCDVIPLEESVASKFNLTGLIVDEHWMKIELLEEEVTENSPIATEHLWGFPIHCSCWELMKINFKHIDTPAAIQALFHICRSQPLGSAVLDWGHSYGYAYSYPLPDDDLLPGEEPHIEGRGTMAAGSLYAYDPYDSTYFDSRAWYGDNTNRDSIQGPYFYTPASTRATSDASDDPFDQLSQELIIAVFVELPIVSDVCSLRLASRACACTRLSETFWRSRFGPGRVPDLHFLSWVVERSRIPGKWSIAYRTATRTHHHEAMYNAKRIWSLVCGLTELVDHRLRCTTHSQGNLYLADRIPADDPIEIGQHTEGALCHPNGKFSEGSRPLFDSFATVETCLIQMSVSFVLINGKRYISGLQFSQDNGVIQRLGYYLHDSRAVDFGFIRDSSPAHVLELHVSVDARGIRGLRLCGNLSKTHYPWIGDHQDLPKKRLYSDSLFSLKCSFDALKMVFIVFLNASRDENDISSKAIDPKDYYLWYPDVPDSNTMLSAPRPYSKAPLLSWVPYSQCTFGGQDGQLLPFLSHITCWSLFGGPAQIQGIEFHYKDSNHPRNDLPSMVLGERPGSTYWAFNKQVFEMNSTGGERLSSIEVRHIRGVIEQPEGIEDFSIDRLKFHTTHGRSVVFPWFQFEHDWGHKRPEGPVHFLRAEEGFIVGLYARIIDGKLFADPGVLSVNPT